MFLKSQHKVQVIFLAEKERTTTKVCFSHNGTPKLGLLQVKPSKDSRDAVCCDGTGTVLCSVYSVCRGRSTCAATGQAG